MDPSPLPSVAPPTLPAELIHQIFQDLGEDMNTLCAAALASKMLQIEAERQLYRRMAHYSVRIHEQFLTRVVETPRLSLLVRAYSHEPLSHESRLRVWELFCSALEVMKNLKHLFLSTRLFATSSIFHGQYDISLESLECRGPYTENPTLLEFLQRQTKLQRLGIEWSREHSSLILSSTCPELQFLRGNKAAIEVFLPGRPISSLYWRDNFEELEPLIISPRLTANLNNVKYLAFGGMTEHPNIDLASIIGHLRRLEVLKILDPTVTDIAMTSRLPNLQILFILCQYPRRSYPDQPFEDLYQLTHDTFTACPTLQSVYISVSAARYSRWIRGLHLSEQTSIPFREMKHLWWEVTPVEKFSRLPGMRNVIVTQRRPNISRQWAKRSEFGERYA